MERTQIIHRIRVIYREVTETAPMSEHYAYGELRKAYNHGKRMVQAHTEDLMVERVMALIDEIIEEKQHG